MDGPTICSLARAIARRYRRRRPRHWRPAERKRIHVFLGTSPIHREAKLNMTPGAGACRHPGLDLPVRREYLG